MKIKSCLFPDMTGRATEREWMDDPDSDQAKLIRTLGQFYWLNRIFTRSRKLLREMILADMLKSPREVYEFLDVGAGGGDIACWFSRLCLKKRIRLRITCLDHDQRIAAYARIKCGHDPRIEILEASLFDLPKRALYDYVFANHFLHHLPSDRVPAAIERMAALTKRIFLINDLRRSGWAYAGFTLFAGVFLHRSFACADGRLSIRKGFLPVEMQALVAGCAGRKQIQIRDMHPARIFLSGRMKP